jgi:Tol biopolymer transport system component
MIWLSGGSGLMIVATVKEALRSQIFYLAYPSGVVTKITNDTNDYSGISLSSDSKRLVTTELRIHDDIWIASADGDRRQLRQITSDEDHWDLSWTPDGRIVDSRTDNDGLNLYLMKADGEVLRQLTFGGRQSFRGNVTPDGRYIVYVSNEKGPYNIWRMDADGSNKTQLTNGSGELAPRLAPDGKTIFYWSVESDRPSVYRVSINGGAPKPLTDKLAQNPAVSPDGKFVACYFGENENEMERQVAILPVSGGPPVKTFNIPFGILQWTRDGTALTYIDVNDGRDVWIRPLDGSEPKRLISFSSRKVSFFDLAPNNKRIAMVCGTRRGDAILLRG